MSQEVKEKDLINLVEVFDETILQAYGDGVIDIIVNDTRYQEAERTACDFIHDNDDILDGVFEETTMIGEVFAKLAVDMLGFDKLRSEIPAEKCRKSNSDAFAKHNCPTLSKLFAPKP